MNADIIIIGAGPVGLFTVFQAGMLGMKSLVIDALEEVGGQCRALYPDKPIYDIPACPEIKAGDLITRLMEHSSPFKPTLIMGHRVTRISKVAEVWEVETDKGLTAVAKVVIIAIGAGPIVPVRPSILSDLRCFENKSVFFSVRDPYHFVDKEICIAGGGDSAVDWAINLAPIAKKIYLVHRREKFRAMFHSMTLLEELREKGRVEFVIPYQLHDIVGDVETGMLREVILSNPMAEETKILKVDRLLCFFGLKSAHHVAKDWPVSLAEDGGGIQVDSCTMEAGSSGLYAIGDIASYPGKLKLILTGFAESARACHSAYEMIKDGPAHFEHSTSKGIKGF